jgi:quinol monooxygenase YgiN
MMTMPSEGGKGEDAMYGVVRRWQAEPSTLQAFVHRIHGALPELRQISGFVSYDVIVAGDTLISTSIYQDKDGADQSTELARRYTREQWTDLKLNPPDITSGEVAVHAAG